MVTLRKKHGFPIDGNPVIKLIYISYPQVLGSPGYQPGGDPTLSQ